MSSLVYSQLYNILFGLVLHKSQLKSDRARWYGVSHDHYCKKKPTQTPYRYISRLLSHDSGILCCSSASLSLFFSLRESRNGFSKQVVSISWVAINGCFESEMNVLNVCTCRGGNVENDHHNSNCQIIWLWLFCFWAVIIIEV